MSDFKFNYKWYQYNLLLKMSLRLINSQFNKVNKVNKVYAGVRYETLSYVKEMVKRE